MEIERGITHNNKKEKDDQSEEVHFLWGMIKRRFVPNLSSHDKGDRL